MFYNSAKEYLMSNAGSDKLKDNNKIKLKGEVASLIGVTSASKMFKLKVYRGNGQEDEFNVYYHVNELPKLVLNKGDYIDIDGEIRTMRRKDKTIISVKAKNVKILDQTHDHVDMLFKDKNKCRVVGYMTRKPAYNIYNNESFQKREVTDGLLAVQDPISKDSSYIPFVTFGQDAYKVGSNIIKGDKIMIEGKFQPRKYTKKDEPGKEYVTYEINAKTIVNLNENNSNYDK